MDRKNEILNVAYQLFSEKGYSLSMSEIAEAVKLKTPSIYSHFKSKDEIIELIIKTEIEDCFETIHKKALKLRDKKCEEKLKSILFYAIEYYDQGSRLRFWRHISLLQNEKFKKMSRTLIQECNMCFEEHIKICFEKGIKAKEIKETVSEGQIYLYFTIIQGVLNATLFVHDNVKDINAYATSVWEAYWDGIKV
ncbi:MAG: TetR/AcrR family transcriptional regulator [Aminipila sp.]